MYALVLLAWYSANLSRRTPPGETVAPLVVQRDAEAH